MQCSLNTHRPLYGPISRLRKLLKSPRCKLLSRPTASEVVSSYIRSSNYPHWTSFFVRYSSLLNDHFGLSSFNWMVDGHNYQILRTGCYPYIKYHCTKREVLDLSLENTFFNVIKVINLGRGSWTKKSSLIAYRYSRYSMSSLRFGSNNLDQAPGSYQHFQRSHNNLFFIRRRQKLKILAN